MLEIVKRLGFVITDEINGGDMARWGVAKKRRFFLKSFLNSSRPAPLDFAIPNQMT
ncbi:MAG: hypothetical protein LBB51_02830 [Zoogloeaceae bacterium]|nr:hypothetical protein [Zoogloeaceae bacterium]